MVRQTLTHADSRIRASVLEVKSQIGLGVLALVRAFLDELIVARCAGHAGLCPGYPSHHHDRDNHHL